MFKLFAKKKEEKEVKNARDVASVIKRVDEQIGRAIVRLSER